MSWIGELMTHAAQGGLFGLIGSAASEALSIWRLKAETQQKKDLAEVEIQKLKAEGELRKQEASIQLESTRERSAGESFTASISADANNHGVSRWVRDVKALTRPILTYSLVILTAALCYTNNVDADQLALAVVSTSSTAVLWWFGSRQINSHKTNPFRND